MDRFKMDLWVILGTLRLSKIQTVSRFFTLESSRREVLVFRHYLPVFISTVEPCNVQKWPNYWFSGSNFYLSPLSGCICRRNFWPFQVGKIPKTLFLDQSVQDTARAWRLNVNLCPSESQNITSYIEKETNGLKLKFLFEKRD